MIACLLISLISFRWTKETIKNSLPIFSGKENIAFSFGCLNTKLQSRVKVHPFDFICSELSKIDVTARDPPMIQYSTENTIHKNLKSVLSEQPYGPSLDKCLIITNSIEMNSGRITLQITNKDNLHLMKEFEITRYCCDGNRSLIDFLIRSHTEYSKMDKLLTREKMLHYLKNYVPLFGGLPSMEWIQMTEGITDIHFIPDIVRNSYVYSALDKLGMVI